MDGGRCTSHKHFPGHPSVNPEETRTRAWSHFSSPITVASFSLIALNKLHISRPRQNYWVAPLRSVSTASICSNGPNSGCVTGDFLCPRRVCAFNISSSKSYTGTTFLHFMLSRCSIPLLLWRKTGKKKLSNLGLNSTEMENTLMASRVPFGFLLGIKKFICCSPWDHSALPTVTTSQRCREPRSVLPHTNRLQKIVQVYPPYWNKRESFFDAVNVGGPHTAAINKRGIYTM